MEFKNKQNEKILHEGRTLWLSRAVAVVGSVVLIKNNVPYILINKRGKGAADFQGKWNLPCGYLDWDETTGEAMMREVYEECGVNLLELIDVLLPIDESNPNQYFIDKPWDTNSDIIENRQNVTFHHGIVVHVSDLPVTSLENNEPDEVEEAKWILLSEYKDYDFCFNHTERIEKFIEHANLYI